ncbi:MAG: RagB/SusD family nutrient uptake outer membrane protein [Mediterranea sp.]|jgi:hypothetical protein|nr:RagB/SusD family nutrient uptake outer membrane protein [Mediterranea sp.]
MKKIIYTLGVVMALSSCADDYLDTTPQSSVSTGIILETTDNAKLALNGICYMMARQYLTTQGFNGEGTIKTWYGNYTGNDFQKCNLTGWAPITNSTYNERNTSVYLYYPWYYYYKLIGNANAIICNIENATGLNEEKDFIKAQALTFRAYSYFMMSQLYCKRWVDSNSGASRGLPLRLDESHGDLPASTLAETYKQVYDDLDEAIGLYKSSGLDRPSNDNYSPNLNVAYAVYARAALTREDWTAAAQYAKLARDGYPLMTNSEYMDGGFNSPNQEWIWSCYGASDQTLHYYSFHAYQGANSSASVCRTYPCGISKELYNQIPETDVRRNMYLDPKGESYTTSNGRASSGALYDRARKDYANKIFETSYIFAYMQFKFLVLDQPGVGHVNNFRSAEMYLTEAEALCHIGGRDTEVQQLLVALNKTSGRNSEYTCTKTGAELLTEVKLYRRIDLWGEGFDWFDYKRWNQPIVRHAHADGGSFHTSFAVTINPSDNNQWTWIYPAKEVDYNADILSYKE